MFFPSFAQKMPALIVALAFVFSAHAQDSLVFNKVSLDSNDRLMAVPSFFDDPAVYKAFCFYAGRKKEVKQIASTLAYGEAITVDTLDHELNVFIIRNKQVLPVRIGISPKYGYITIEEQYYRFDVAQLQGLAGQQPLSYRTKTQRFETEAALNAFLKKYKNDPAFLCLQDITEEPEGRFTISIKIEGQEDPVMHGWKLIETDLQNLGAEEPDDYTISYEPKPGSGNMYQYTVMTDKALYGKLENAAYVKGKWTMNAKEVVGYWRK